MATGQQQIERLDRGNMLPQPQEKMVGLVALAPIGGLQKGVLGRLDAAGVQRGEVQQTIGRGHRIVDVLVRQSHMLQHRKKPIVPFEPPNQLRHSIQARQRMQRAAMMTRRQIGRARHRQRRGRQHRLRCHAGAQLVQRAIQNLVSRGFLDEPDQRFDGIGKTNTLRHGVPSVRCASAQRLLKTLAGPRPTGHGRSRNANSTSNLIFGREACSVNN